MAASLDDWQRRQDKAFGTGGPLIGTPAAAVKTIGSAAYHVWVARG